MLRKLLTPNIQRIKSIRASGTMLNKSSSDSEIGLGNLYNIRQTHLIMRIKLSYLERCTCLPRSFNVLTSVEVSAYTDRSKQILLVTNHSSSSMFNKLLRVFSSASGLPT